MSPENEEKVRPAIEALTAWEAARLLPDEEAAHALRVHLLKEILPTIPGYEFFTLKRILDRIAFLNPAEAHACLAAIRASTILPLEYESDDQEDPDLAQDERWKRFLGQLETEVRLWSRPRELAGESPAVRESGWRAASAQDPGGWEHWCEVSVFLLAEALVDPLRAVRWIQPEWRGILPWINDEVVLRLERSSPELALDWIEQNFETAGISSTVPLLLLARELQPEGRFDVTRAQRLVAMLPRFGAVASCIGAFRLLAAADREAGVSRQSFHSLASSLLAETCFRALPHDWKEAVWERLERGAVLVRE